MQWYGNYFVFVLKFVTRKIISMWQHTVQQLSFLPLLQLPFDSVEINQRNFSLGN